MDSELLSILACPGCRGHLSPLTRHDKDIGLACAACAVIYPIKDDIPILLIEEGVPKRLWEQASAGE
ncbi:MAG: Trm112 family protein [Desulfovibrio sp.]|jgi:uncharacterized protein YbaR (Trm112 family)|nr:Trm112 family protein [Desulfovibrio sp.]